MTRNRLIALMLAATAFVAATYLLRPGSASDSADAALDPPTTATDPERRERDRLIDLFSRRAAERGESLDYRTAGGLLLERAGLDASVDDYAAAGDAFRTALDIAPDVSEALLGLGQAALGTHEFSVATDAAERLLAREPSSAGGLALAADAAFARGAYDDAADALDELVSTAADDPARDELVLPTDEDPAVAVRLSQLALVRSTPEQARRHAADAVRLAERQGLTGIDLAFYESYAGNQAYELGDYDEATDLLESAVDHAPTDHGALGELARVRAATGALDEAIELLERANALVPEPDHLVLQGDLRTLAGDDDEGAEADYAEAVRIATRNADHERAWARALAFYMLDHDGDIDQAREIVDSELAVRADAGAWDLDAWAYYRAGELDEARSSVETALELSRYDAGTWYHAGVISAELGNRDRAVDELTRALDLNPGFDPLASRHAQDLLEQLT